MTGLIDRLVDDLTPVRPRDAGSALVPMLLSATLVALVVVTAAFGPRPDLAAVFATPPFWIKVAAMALLSALAWSALAGLARPGSPTGHGLMAAGLLVAGLLLAGGLTLLIAPAEARLGLLLGHSWQHCLWKVALLSAPFLLAGMAGLRRMVPTRLRTAGFAAGLMAGASGAALYAIACQEDSLAFLSVWYLLAIALVCVTGALLGPRLLRW